MPQLHLYLSEQLANEVKRRAEARQISVSSYLAEIVQSQLGRGWPEDFFDKVVGGWKGKPLKRPAQGQFESRDSL